ncbi:MAG: hypothetical protein ACTSQJ_10695 [Promethearchaeota archaeon]
MKLKSKFILNKVFGNTVRIKVLEILINNNLENDSWLNISKIAKIANISTSSSKRIIDKLIEDKFVDLKPIQTHAKNPEKEIKLNTDNKIINELIFFYQKLKGFT